MTELQGAAVAFAPLFAIFGVCFIAFHQHMSDAARRVREEQRQWLGPRTSDPVAGGSLIKIGEPGPAL